MERLSDTVIEIVNELHKERLDYNSEYLPLIDALNHLAAYEDTGLGPQTISEILDSVSEWYDAHKEGRLLVLPCKVGDELWFEKSGVLRCETVDRVQIEQTDIDDGWCVSIYTMSVSVLAEDIGRLVWLSRETAEAALKERDGA